MEAWSLVSKALRFQSALPRGERHHAQVPRKIDPCISIRTPTRGATQMAYCNGSQFGNFNPHSHEGSDHLHLEGLFIRMISIRTPTRGATFEDDEAFLVFFISIRTPTRGATYEQECIAGLSDPISIRTPTRGAT